MSIFFNDWKALHSHRGRGSFPLAEATCTSWSAVLLNLVTAKSSHIKKEHVACSSALSLSNNTGITL